MKLIILLTYLDIVLTSYYELALLKCPSSDIFTIHGLWPNEINYPEFCSKEKFNIDEIQPVLNEMNTFWKSCYENNTLFWTHEWSKHGTCTKMTQLNYFNKTINLYHNAITNNYTQYCDKNELDCQLNYDHDFNFIK